MVVLAGVTSSACLYVNNWRVVPPESLIVERPVAISNSAISRSGPHIFLHARIFLLLAGDLGIELCGLVSCDELSVAFLNSVDMLNFFGNILGQLAVAVAVKDDSRISPSVSCGIVLMRATLSSIHFFSSSS